MSDERLQFIIVVTLGGLCFGCGYLTAFIVTRTRFRNQMIKRGAPATTRKPANGNGKSRLRDIECHAPLPFRQLRGAYLPFCGG
jgi:hypothetical protein